MSTYGHPTRRVSGTHTRAYEDYTICEYRVTDGVLTYQEGGLLRRFGITMPELLGELGDATALWPLASEYAKSTREHVAFVASDTTEGRRAYTDVETLFVHNGIECWVSMSSMVLYYEDAMMLGIMFTSINDAKNRMLKLAHDAEVDTLTGTLNRAALRKAVDGITADGGSHALIMLDIDKFKGINDTYGHIVGDKILIAMVKNLRQGLRRDDVLGRMGGDEFALCLRSVPEKTLVDRLAGYICSLARNSMPEGINVTVSLGIALCPRDGTRFDELYRNADIALYSVKHGGGDGYAFCAGEEETHGSPDEGAPSKAASRSESRPESRPEHRSLLLCYDILSDAFTYPEGMEEVFKGSFDTRPLWQLLTDCGIASADTAERLRAVIRELRNLPEDAAGVRYAEYFMKTVGGRWRWFRWGFIRSPGSESIMITLTDINDDVVENRRRWNQVEYDDLTGLLEHTAFNRAVEMILLKDAEGVAAGEYALLYMDIVRFKAINDMFGMTEGDRVLIYIADMLSASAEDGGAACRIDSDRFVLFAHKKGEQLQELVENYLQAIARYELPIEVVSNVGIYVIEDEGLDVDAMLDRAILAQAAIKGSYTERMHYYDEDLRQRMLSEQEIAGSMTSALSTDQFVVYYQPQYDHITGELVGAEALVRWMHPEKGMIMPGVFIPIFERNGFITKLDFYVLEQVCRFLRRCLDRGLRVVPVSVNLTRYDIFQADFLERLEGIRTRYDVPAALLRLEITESAIVGSIQHIVELIARLHELGYVIEMDDFGSGYSSLNVLKDIDIDILKLDMQFVSGDIGRSRSGPILSSVVRMAQWLSLPVIAEGIENVHQADYLRSIGCSYIQGYLYARPMPEENYISTLATASMGETLPRWELAPTLDSGRFWDPDSQETLIFSSYVGAADIFLYNRNGQIEPLRMNSKFAQEISDELSEQELLKLDPLQLMDEGDRQRYIETLERAIAAGDEQECEYWRSSRPQEADGCTGCGRVFLRSTVRMLASGEGSYLFYETIRNITAEKLAETALEHQQSLFRAASEQANIYYWEYDVATKEMYPCFRCIRDLGLPEVVSNYPDTAIEMGIFPPEAAEAYREMHRRIDEGVEEQEAIIPLTADRIPFRVRYTTRFDEEGKPVKAYGSATLI